MQGKHGMTRKVATGMHTHHTIGDTQLNERTKLHKGDNDSKSTFNTVVSQKNMNEARGVDTDLTKQYTSEARGVCTKILSAHIISMGNCSNQTGKEE